MSNATPIWLGIDPGKHGGVAAVWDGGGVAKVTPLLPNARGRDEFDVAACVTLLQSLALLGTVQLVTIERLHAMPAVVNGRPIGGASANFARGESRGWVWACAALRYPHQLVLPKRWQEPMLAGTSGSADTKARSIEAARRLFPLVNLLPTARSRKPADGLTDALLLAEYGRRTTQPPPIEAAQGVA